jgi:hypothetical protein
MATVTRDTSSINGRSDAAPAVIRPANLADQQLPGGFLRILPAWIISGVVHVLLLLLFLGLTWNSPSAGGTVDQPPNDGQIDDNTTVQADLTETETGIDKSVSKTNYDVPLIENVSVPGKVDPGGSIGIPGAPDGPATTIAPPPGIGRGSGGAILDPTKIGNGSVVGQEGGYLGGVYVPGGFNGRGGAARKRMVKEGGGTGESEAAVGLGLQWLSIHQSNNGSWSLDKFHQHAHEIGGGPASKEFRCDCGGQGQNNDIAATAFGLLPFLGAGQTHQPPKDKPAVDYHKTVKAGIEFLLSKQKSDGDFGGGMYAQGLAAIALCECYALTADSKLKPAAQRAIDFIKNAQHEGGGWRYKPKEAGDTSVVGWQVMALKSAQLAGLNVPKETLDGATKFLNSVMTSDGSGYGYTSPNKAPTTTAVGCLCRQYLGWNYKNPNLLAGVETLKGTPPGKIDSIYYYYYATQVMHHMQGESWEAWNPKMRDSLLAKQDKGTDAKHPHQKGSWSPVGDAHGPAGGRLMVTSLAILTLEVYYRYLPLYRRDMGAMKDMEANP